MRWLKRWSWLVSLIVAFLALTTAVIAVFVTWHMYTQTERPHTEFETACEKLNTLDNKISEADNWIGKHENLGEDVAEWKTNLQQARVLRDDAQAKIIEDDYAEAERLIKQAYALANTVPRPPYGKATNWGAIVGAIVGGALLLVIAFASRLRRKGK